MLRTPVEALVQTNTLDTSPEFLKELTEFQLYSLHNLRSKRIESFVLSAVITSLLNCDCQRLTRSDGGSPCEPVVQGAVGVVQPELIFGARQTLAELYHVADLS